MTDSLLPSPAWWVVSPAILRFHIGEQGGNVRPEGHPRDVRWPPLAHLFLAVLGPARLLLEHLGVQHLRSDGVEAVPPAQPLDVLGDAVQGFGQGVRSPVVPVGENLDLPVVHRREQGAVGGQQLPVGDGPLPVPVGGDGVLLLGDVPQVVERLLQPVRIGQFREHLEPAGHRGPLLVRQVGGSTQEDEAVVHKSPANLRLQALPLGLADGLHRHARHADDVELVHHDSGLGHRLAHGVEVRTPHVHRDHLDRLPLGEGLQVGRHGLLVPLLQHPEDGPLGQVGQNAPGPLEQVNLVDAHAFGRLEHGLGVQPLDVGPEHVADGLLVHPHVAGHAGERPVDALLLDVPGQPASHLAPLVHVGELLEERHAAFGAAVTLSGQFDAYPLAVNGQVHQQLLAAPVAVHLGEHLPALDAVVEPGPLVTGSLNPVVVGRLLDGGDGPARQVEEVHGSILHAGEQARPDGLRLGDAPCPSLVSLHHDVEALAVGEVGKVVHGAEFHGVPPPVRRVHAVQSPAVGVPPHGPAVDVQAVRYPVQSSTHPSLLSIPRREQAEADPPTPLPSQRDEIIQQLGRVRLVEGGEPQRERLVVAQGPPPIAGDVVQPGDCVGVAHPPLRPVGVGGQVDLLAAAELAVRPGVDQDAGEALLIPLAQPVRVAGVGEQDRHPGDVLGLLLRVRACEVDQHHSPHWLGFRTALGPEPPVHTGRDDLTAQSIRQRLRQRLLVDRLLRGPVDLGLNRLDRDDPVLDVKLGFVHVGAPVGALADDGGAVDGFGLHDSLQQWTVKSDLTVEIVRLQRRRINTEIRFDAALTCREFQHSNPNSQDK